MSSRLISRFVLTFLALLTFTGCTTSVNWDVHTTYEVRDLGNQVTIREALTKAIMQPENGNPYGFEQSDPGTSGPYRFTLTKLKTMDQLTEVQRIIRKITKDYSLPVDLTQADLVFQSVEGKGQTDIIVTITATPRSLVSLDTGESVATMIDIDDSGKSRINVKPNEKLRVRGGWIYGMVKKGRTILYFRTNVLDRPDQSDTIPAESLPNDTILERKPAN